MQNIKRKKLILFGIIVFEVILFTMPAIYAQDEPFVNEWVGSSEGEVNYDADSSAPPPVLGSTSEDFVFTPVNPCRIIDTRNAGGKIPSFGIRSFFVHGPSLTEQGGNPGGCIAPRGEPRSVLMNIVAVNSTGAGYLTVWPYATTQPLAGVLNYNPANKDPISNAFTVKTSYDVAYDISIYAKTETHVVADVMGYYYDAVGVAGVDYDGGNQTVSLTKSASIVRSIDVSMPTAGYVVVNASGYFYNTSDEPATFRCSISTSTAIDYDALVFSTFDAAYNITENWAATRTFEYNTAGTRTFRVVCDAFYGSGTVNDVHLNGIFLSKRY